jgi:hypothetical protein
MYGSMVRLLTEEPQRLGAADVLHLQGFRVEG